MNKSLPNVSFTSPKTNPIIDSNDSHYALPYKKDAEFFSIIDNFVNFIKSVERIFRTSEEYKKYISHLKNDIGLNCCQITANIDDSLEKVTIEMHHAILTLFDLVGIIVDDQIARGEKLTTFSVANLIAQAHFDHLVPTVFLTKTNHELVHCGEIFLHYDQAFGDLDGFLKRFKYGVTPEIIAKVEKYIDVCKRYDFFDNGVLVVDKSVGKWFPELDEIIS